MSNSESVRVGYWGWFFKGANSKPGIYKLLDRWLFVHGLIGVCLAKFTPLSLESASASILLPLVSIFVGLSFAWAGNAQSILQTDEMEQVTKKHPDGTPNYVFTFQTSVLIILVTVCIWGIAGLKIFDCVWPTSNAIHTYFALKSISYFISSMTIRECWQVVQAVNIMLVVRGNVKNKMQSHPPERDSR